MTSQTDSFINKIHSHTNELRNNKYPRPLGAIDRQMFNRLNEGDLFFMVWALGPASWIVPAKVRRILPYDSKDDHLGKAWIVDWNEQFPYVDLRQDEYKDRDYRIHAKDFYASYNLHLDDSKNYNDSYIFLGEQAALDYLEVCKSRPRFKTEQEKQVHEQLLKDLDNMSYIHAYDIDDDMCYDNVYYDHPLEE